MFWFRNKQYLLIVRHCGWLFSECLLGIVFLAIYSIKKFTEGGIWVSEAFLLLFWLVSLLIGTALPLSSLKTLEHGVFYIGNLTSRCPQSLEFSYSPKINACPCFRKKWRIGCWVGPTMCLCRNFSNRSNVLGWDLSLLNVSCVSSAALLIYFQINVTVIVMCLGGTKDGPAKYCSDIIGIQ